MNLGDSVKLGLGDGGRLDTRATYYSHRFVISSTGDASDGLMPSEALVGCLRWLTSL